MADYERLSKVCEEGLEAVGYELVDLEYLREPGGWVLRVFIDKAGQDPASDAASAVETREPGPVPVPASPITHQDCKSASHHLGTVLDVEDLIGSAYRLEVSSPGVQRPVRKEEDFIRFSGHRAKVVLSEPLDGRIKFTGVIQGAGQGKAVLEVEGERVEFELAMMKKARLEVDL